MATSLKNVKLTTIKNNVNRRLPRESKLVVSGFIIKIKLTKKRMKFKYRKAEAD